MKWYDNSFWIWFGHIVNILNVVALVPLGFLVKRVQQQWRMTRIMKASTPATPIEQTGILIFNIFAGTIEPQVISYMRVNFPDVLLDKRHVFSSSLKFDEK